MIVEAASRYWWRRFVEREACSWEELESFPRQGPARQRRILSERLLAQVQYFGNRADALPEWREAARITNPDELWKAWPSLPVLTKKDLQAWFPAGELQSRFRLEGVVKSTGGSTGEPTHVFHDTPMMRAANAASTYTRLKMGWRPGMATVKVWGSERDIRRRVDLRTRLYTRLLRDIVVDGYEMNDHTVSRFLALVRRYRPVSIWGFSSMLDFVAKAIVQQQACPPPGSVRTAWNGGEMLLPGQNETFRRAFGVAILNRYGGRELSTMACQFEDGGPLVVLRPWLFVEIVNDSGRPAGPGESGRLLWTSTICRGTPILRYDIGDLASFLPTHEDESGISALSDLHGRAAGILDLPDGRKINCLYWNHLFKEFHEVHQFQIVLQQDGSLDCLLKGSGFTGPREAALRTTAQSFLGGVRMNFKWVEQIPLTQGGKLLQVVRAQPSSSQR
jgi:phenylacetate-CoA ligase